MPKNKFLWVLNLYSKNFLAQDKSADIDLEPAYLLDSG